MPDYRLEVVAEEFLSDEARRAAAALVYAQWGNSEARERGWNKQEPLYRVLAWKGTELVGQRMTCRLENDQGVVMLGFGDLVVAPRHRRRGLARQMTALAVEEAVRRGADLLASWTVTMRPVYLALGFHDALPGEVVLREEGRAARNNELLVRWQREPLKVVFYEDF